MIVVSPDGNYVYYSASLRSEPNVADVFRIPILGGPPKKVASDIEFHFSLSPDGKMLAFRRFSAVTRESALWLADLEAGTERALLRWHGADRIGDPSFEPDGRQIAFRGRHGGASKRGQAFLLDIATGDIKPFEAPKGWPSSIKGFVWLPDASGILACVADSHQPSQVWQLNRDGSSRKLTSDLAFYQEISVAADGKAFVALRNEQSSNLVLVPLDRPSEMSPLTSGIGNYDGMGGARWMSDREIVYGSFAGGTQSINITGIDRREPRELATGQFWNIRPSPDGRLVGAVASSDNGSDLVVIDAAGGPPRQITHGSNAESFDWMPDGTGFVYLSSDSVQAAWLQPLAGGPPRRLTQMPVNGVRVSPDGTKLLLRMRSTTPGTPLWRTAIVPLAGGEPQFYPVPLAGGPAQLEWAPDGRAFTYCEYANGVPNLWLQPLDGSAPRQLTKFESGQIYGYGLSRDGKSAVVARGEQSRDLVLIRDFR
jgi:Tol biopolymer transport system component